MIIECSTLHFILILQNDTDNFLIMVAKPSQILGISRPMTVTDALSITPSSHSLLEVLVKRLWVSNSTNWLQMKDIISGEGLRQPSSIELLAIITMVEPLNSAKPPHISSQSVVYFDY